MSIKSGQFPQPTGRPGPRPGPLHVNTPHSSHSNEDPRSKERAAIYGLKYPARALAAVVGNQDQNRFLVGSYTPGHPNELHMLDFDEDEYEIKSKVFNHPNEIHSISCSPTNATYLFTTHNAISDSGSEIKATLWSLDGTRLRELASLGPHEGAIREVIWSPTEADRICSMDDGYLRTWKLENLVPKDGDIIAIPPTEKKAGNARISRGCWSPHSATQVATANDLSLRGWDLRTLRQAFVIDHAHASQVRDVDYNPGVANQIASCGDDGFVKFWDLRMVKSPVKEIRHHTHWVWRVAYNRFYDQLVLTAGSDARINLESMVSISSAMAPGAAIDDSEEHKTKEKAKDGLIAALDHHEDSVYSIAWSAGDPWIFASLSFDGRVVVSLVPREEKYKIIL